jgi:hypothetical protein
MKGFTVKTARLSKGYVSPRYRSGARLFMLLASRLYIALAEKLSRITLINPELLCQALKDQQEGKYRLIILFRHSDKADASALTYGLNFLVRKEGRKGGIKFSKRPHAFFLYGKDVPNWAGALAGWIFPRLGNIPVINRGLCQKSIEDLKLTLKKNRFPLALAPEGQVTYHTGRVFDLEGGLVHMVDWASEHGPVRLLPLIPLYDYGSRKETVLEKVRKKWMNETGINLETITTPYSFLMELTEKTVILLEKNFPAALQYSGNQTKMEQESPEGKSLNERIHILNETIIHEGEKVLGIKKTGSFLDRIFRIRYRGVDTFYPENRDPAEDTPWERSASDFNCVKTTYAVWCSQIADVLEYIHTDYISEEPLNNRHCEYALNLLDVVNRFRGGDIGTRFSPGKRKASLLTGNLIDPAHYRNIAKRKERHAIIMEKVREELEKISQNYEELI